MYVDGHDGETQLTKGETETLVLHALLLGRAMCEEDCSIPGESSHMYSKMVVTHVLSDNAYALEVRGGQYGQNVVDE